MNRIGSLDRRTLAFSGIVLPALACSILALAPLPARGAEAPSSLLEQGRYVAVLGDCVACHTARPGTELAGGLALATPFGTLYSTNITPDRATGIGGYTFEQFERAMRRGIAADGRNLYPAMPYPSYTRVSDEDLRALYAYLMQGVQPATQPNKPADMSWPFSMRWGLGVWNAAFLDDAPFRPDPARDATWNRGAYLVQSLGHCGACHTPRGIAFQEKAVADQSRDGTRFLAGETVEGWHAPSLRKLWTVDDTVTLLRHGQNRFGSVAGSMVEVIHHSTQHFSDPDLVAMATYLESLPAGAAAAPMPVRADVARKVPGDLYTTRGGLGYVQFCASCHRTDGAGVAGVFPPLAGNPTLAARDPATLLHLGLTGWKTAQTTTHPQVYTMPGYAKLSDQEIAEILTFVRRSWAPDAKPVTVAEVGKLRVELAAYKGQEPPFHTPRMADMLKQPNAAQLVRGMRLHFETAALLPQNVGNPLSCSSCHLNAGTVAEASPFVGVSASFPGYAPRAGRVITLADRINGCFLRSMNGKPVPVDSEDMKAMVAYFEWMRGPVKAGDKVPGRGVGKMDMAVKPDAANGVRIYETQCATCHGKNGEGLRQADGRWLYPPLWGEQSFNLGAGMARTYTAAAFVKRNMPVGYRAQFPLAQGGLTDQEAVDVAEYFSHQPRPDFAAKAKDWPKDPKPADARY